ncbi:hypothetical protein G9A89_014075 [Geosiphon pyriformis]|nr:hypothetical protein G9A89_014075 [Geosiphon pyriformis]
MSVTENRLYFYVIWIASMGHEESTSDCCVTRYLINNSKKRWDRIAFFVFFTFKGWKRLMFAEAPRQAINAFTLYSILQSKKFSLNYNSYGDNLVQRVAMFLMAFTLGIFVISASLLAFAFLLYLPLLCHIRGNLKEYCCHKIDKRIGELLKKKSKDRYQKQRAKAQAEAQGDYSHLKNKKGELTSQPLREPTLPTLAYFETTHSVPPLPPYQRVPSPVMFEDRNLANSRDPYYVNGGPRAGNPGYGHSSLLPPTSSLSPHYGANAAGQRQPYQPTNRYSNSSLHSDVNRLNPAYTINGYQGHIQSGIQNHQMGMNSVPPRRNYNNLNLVQAAAMNNSTITSTYNDNKSSPSDYENEGKNTEDLSSDDDDDGPPKPPSETNSITPVLAQYKKKDSSSGKHGSSHLSVDVAYQLRSQPNRSSKNNSYNNNNQYLNRHNQYDYLIQPSRSESTTSSIGSNGSAVRLNRGVGSGASNSTPSVSVRYQHEQYPRYDNNNDNNNYYGAKASNQRARDGGY